MLSVELIFDRTSADVFEAEEMMKLPWWEFTEEQQLAFLNGLRGCYDYTDLNRVETAVTEISRRMVSLPERMNELSAELGGGWDKYQIPYKVSEADLKTKTTWSGTELMTEEERTRYLANVEYIRSIFAPDVSAVENFDNFDFEAANRIEEILSTADFAVDALEEKITNEIEEDAARFKIWSGEPYSGEVII